jgi:hypothetical protein
LVKWGHRERRDHREKIKEIEPQIAQINTDFISHEGTKNSRGFAWLWHSAASLFSP